MSHARKKSKNDPIIAEDAKKFIFLQPPQGDEKIKYEMCNEENSNYFLFRLLNFNNNKETAYVELEKRESKIHIGNVGVVPEEQNKGLGSFLMNQVLNWVLSNKLDLVIDGPTETAYGFYKEYFLKYHGINIEGAYRNFIAISHSQLKANAPEVTSGEVFSRKIIEAKKGPDISLRRS